MPDIPRFAFQTSARRPSVRATFPHATGGFIIRYWITPEVGGNPRCECPVYQQQLPRISHEVYLVRSSHPLCSVAPEDSLAPQRVMVNHGTDVDCTTYIRYRIMPAYDAGRHGTNFCCRWPNLTSQPPHFWIGLCARSLVRYPVSDNLPAGSGNSLWHPLGCCGLKFSRSCKEPL